MSRINMSQRLYLAVACVAAAGIFFNTAVAVAATIDLTGGFSGGNPGGQPLYEVSGLVEGDAFNVSWGGVAGLSIEGMVTIDSLTATAAEIRVMLENMSTPTSGGDPRVTSFGIAIDGYTALGSTATGGAELDTADDGNFPGFTTDVCGTSGSNCSGGGSDGIDAGGMDEFVLEVSGNFAGSLTLKNFALKVQGAVGGASFELAGIPTPKPDDNMIPEPATLTLLGLAIAGLFIRRHAA